ncbi:hypothetical protein PIB30_036541 [Stylosanthes scabra]|uniref:Uncharacterized protein n=1 Tax=Stylosanthes scabra TaxID=79078 RepID=A0ABU6TD53_9FABA|nr:hypothetical protein [Stylosanthes scabra]
MFTTPSNKIWKTVFCDRRSRDDNKRKKNSSRQKQRQEDNQIPIIHNDKRLNRKLDFDVDDVDMEELGDVAQQGFGSPFTYGMGNGNHSGLEIPWCFRLVWRPPKEMVFCGKELVVAAYIYNADLPQM